MADKVEQPTEVEEVKKTKSVEEDETVEDSSDEKVLNGDESAEKNGDNETETEEKTDEKCTIKRKSTGGGGDATDNASGDEQPTPEKKAKVSESTEVEAAKEEATAEA